MGDASHLRRQNLETDVKVRPIKSLMLGLRGTHRAATLCSFPQLQHLRSNVRASPAQHRSDSCQLQANSTAGARFHAQRTCQRSLRCLARETAGCKASSWSCTVKATRNPYKALQAPQHLMPNLMLGSQPALELNNPAPRLGCIPAIELTIYFSSPNLPALLGRWREPKPFLSHACQPRQGHFHISQHCCVEKAVRK